MAAKLLWTPLAAPLPLMQMWGATTSRGITYVISCDRAPTSGEYFGKFVASARHPGQTHSERIGGLHESLSAAQGAVDAVVAGAR